MELFHHAQLRRYSEAAALLIPGDPATDPQAGDRPWHLYITLVLQEFTILKLGEHGGFHQISKAGGSQAKYITVYVSAGAPKSVIHEAMKVKSKLEWRSQELRDASHVNCLMRKAADCRESQSKRQPMCPANGKAKRAGLSKPCVENISLPCVLDAYMQNYQACLLGWVLVLLLPHPFCVCSRSSTVEWECLLCAIVYCIYVTCL